MNIVKAQPGYVRWNVGGPDFDSSRSLVNAALASMVHDEITVHGAIGLLSADELRSMLTEMDAAWDVYIEKQRDRMADFQSNWS